MFNDKSIVINVKTQTIKEIKRGSKKFDKLQYFEGEQFLCQFQKEALQKE
jgi:hypothetical protein